jgi:hypothetical protein
MNKELNQIIEEYKIATFFQVEWWIEECISRFRALVQAI